MQLLTARPKSSGTVGLRSTDPFDLPKVRATVNIAYYLPLGHSAVCALLLCVCVRELVPVCRNVSSTCSAMQTQGWSCGVSNPRTQADRVLLMMWPLMSAQLCGVSL
jgi:hypothetical protein